MTDYIFHSEIGRGGFGIVYDAEEVGGAENWVAKTLKRRASLRDERRFRREVRLQAKLNHRHIVPIVNMNLDDEPPWFIMPRAEENLREYLDRAGPGEDRLWVFEQVASGIEYAHANGVIHRDLKPQNVLIFEDPEEQVLSAAVSDFGLGLRRDRDSTPLTPSHSALGTIEYAAPEQWADAKNVDERTDIYALGKILYEVLTGYVPYPDSAMDLNLVPKPYAFIIQKATQADPDDRYPTVTALLADVRYVREAPADLKRPAEVANDLIQVIMRGGTFSGAKVEPLVRHLATYLDDYQLLTQVVPKIPVPILTALLAHHRQTFRRVFEAYDDEASGSLPFEYCDVVADFYAQVFGLTSDSTIRSLIIRRLPTLGHAHNRWHVGQVFGRLVGGLSDSSMVMTARDVLLQNPEAAQWCAEYLRDSSVPIAIRRAAGLT